MSAKNQIEHNSVNFQASFIIKIFRYFAAYEQMLFLFISGDQKFWSAD